MLTWCPAPSAAVCVWARYRGVAGSINGPVVSTCVDDAGACFQPGSCLRVASGALLPNLSVSEFDPVPCVHGYAPLFVLLQHKRVPYHCSPCVCWRCTCTPCFKSLQLGSWAPRVQRVLRDQIARRGAVQLHDVGFARADVSHAACGCPCWHGCGAQKAHDHHRRGCFRGNACHARSVASKCRGPGRGAAGLRLECRNPACRRSHTPSVGVVR